MAGGFNTDLGEMASDGRVTEIAAALTEAGLEDMTAHFLPRKRRWGEGTADVEHGEGGEGHTVSDGLPPGD